jgi:hypothetical protein
MKNEKYSIILNESLIDNLNNMSFDIKYNLNLNARDITLLDENKIKTMQFLDDNEIEKFIEIRKKIKELSYNLKKKLKEKL